jgi:hypothetical protein
MSFSISTAAYVQTGDDLVTIIERAERPTINDTM